jgi:hypothetical protein
MGYVSVDVDIDDVLWSLSSYEKQELVDDLYDGGYIAKKDYRSENNQYSDWDEAVEKLKGNKWRLSKEDEETILQITNKIL